MANDSISLGDLQARMKAAEAEFLQAEEAVRKAVAQRDRLRTAFQVFKELLGENGVGGGPPPALTPFPAPVSPPPPPVRPVSSSARRRHRKKKTPSKPPSTAELAIQELEARGEFLTTKELLDILLRKGFKPNPKLRPWDALYGLLWHGAKKKDSRLVKRDMKWGLLEWGSEFEEEESP